MWAHITRVYIIIYESSPAGNPGNPPGALFADRASWYITELEYLATPLVAAAARGFAAAAVGDHWQRTHTLYIIIIVFANVILPARLPHTIIRVGTIIIIIIIITNNAASSLSWGDRHFITDCVLRVHVLLYYHRT